MAPAELALAEKGGATFADLCWRVREARMAANRAIKHHDACVKALKQAGDAIEAANAAEDEARADLDELIDRETSLD